ncbi:MAG: putative transporter [Verrucomicrobia bacterium]|nr:putative transporter [Verrucomicrobiota bacterium]
MSDSIRDLIILTLVMAGGLSLGKIRLGSFHLGVAGVLLSGIFFAQIGWLCRPEIRHFARDLGLVIFVYAIGNQLGPAFFTCFRREGWQLNLVAVVIVVGGTLLAGGISIAMGICPPLVLGTLAGAVTNTPSLAATQETFPLLHSLEDPSLIGVGYSLAYPVGILGILAVIIGLRAFSKTDPIEESRKFEKSLGEINPPLQSLSLVVQNSLLIGRTIRDLLLLSPGTFSVSRHFSHGIMRVAAPDQILAQGDILQVIAETSSFVHLHSLIGPAHQENLATRHGSLIFRQIVVTRRAVLGHRMDPSRLDSALAGRVVITRLNRAGIEFVPPPGLRWQFGDVVRVVGEEEDVEAFAMLLGNSHEELSRPHLLPLMLGLAIGIGVGLIPISMPNLPVPLRLGMAGGPLLVALFLTQLRPVGRFTWQLPPATNELLRHAGIALFLSAVGLEAGQAWSQIAHPTIVVQIVGMTLLLTMTPLVIGVIIARLFFKLPVLQVCGLLAGSMTDPPALAFVNQIAPGNMASLAFTSVYPLVMMSRVLAAQILTVLLLK